MRAPSWHDGLVSVSASLKGALRKHGVTVATAKAADVGNPMFSGDIGLKAKDFFEALEKSAGAGAVISLAGAPLLKPGDAARVSSDHPPVLVVATAMQGNKMGLRSDPVQLARLLEAKVIQLAIIDGAGPAVNPAGKPHDPRAKNSYVEQSLAGRAFRRFRHSIQILCWHA